MSTSVTGTQTHLCQSAKTFIARLTPSFQTMDIGVTHNFIYRGVSDATHELVPSALRTDERSKQAISRLKSLEPDERVILDVTVLRLFYQEANRNGLLLPHVSHVVHDALARGVTNIEVRGTMSSNELLPIFGLAQHYGLPTRLLDWTFDPMVAMYFAAAGACRRLREEGTSRSNAIRLAVWKLVADFDRFGVQLICPPYSGNPNLAAQRGAFTYSNALDATPLNVAFATEDPANCLKFDQYILPAKEAPHLLWELRCRGYDAGRVFPGYGGAARAVDELSMIRQILQLGPASN